MFFGNMEMRGFAQRSHERKIMGEKSHPFSGWNGPPRITKNEVRSARLGGGRWRGGCRARRVVRGASCAAAWRGMAWRGMAWRDKAASRRSARSAGCVRACSACVEARRRARTWGADGLRAARGLRVWQHKAWMHGLNQETGMGSILSRAMKNVKI